MMKTDSEEVQTVKCYDEHRLRRSTDCEVFSKGLSFTLQSVMLTELNTEYFIRPIFIIPKAAYSCETAWSPVVRERLFVVLSLVSEVKFIYCDIVCQPHDRFNIVP